MVTQGDSLSIDEVAAEIGGSLIRLRRTIHRHPELAGDERRTAALVAERLLAAGLKVRTGVGGHGIVAILEGAQDGPTVAFRADMDAVHDLETFDGDYASVVPGVAHICGHDVHTAVGVGVAEVLSRLRDQFAGRIMFLFQPAEERNDGALDMLADGAFAPDALPAEVFALHCSPWPVGSFAVMPGSGLAGQDQFTIVTTGPDAVAARDRLRAEADALGTVTFPTTEEEFEQIAVEMMTPGSSLSRFVQVYTYPITDNDAGADADADGTRADFGTLLRAWPDDRYPEIRAQVEQLVAAVPGASVEYTPGTPWHALVSSPELSHAAGDYLSEVFGPEAVSVLYNPYPFSGEDFGHFIEQVAGAGAYVLLGVANPEKGILGMTHQWDFTVDEDAIGIGVQAAAGLLLRRLQVLTAPQ